MRLLSLLALFAALPAALAAPLPAPAQEAAAGASAAGEAAAPSYPAISVIAAAPRLMSDRVLATGLVAPVEEVLVQPLIEGQPIEALLADVGDSVRAGQVLAVLSKTTLELQKSQSIASLASARATIAQAEAQMVEAEASAADAERTAERARKLREQGAASQAAADTANLNAIAATARVTVARQSLAAARAQVTLIEAQLAYVDLQLTRTEVTAPYAGRITARNAVIGAVATAAGQPMFVLEKDGALELRADVAEGDVLRIAPGMVAELRAAGLEAPLAGSVRMVEPQIDRTTRLGRVRIAIEDGAHLVSGMYVDASIILARREAVAVPVSAIGAADGEAVVLRVTEGLVELVPVSLGMREGGWVEIVAGLMAGDSVVSKAGAFVRPGDRITPVADTATN
ncbi:MAG: efflux RND transporter periplasmic adaptor subunit [Rhodobacteraceae bacterium]|jgi:HlyD family secretion protein|nr:efflux RND transporter periplasmic adaptor subunit [Paracoccaceae bacterium]